MNSAIALHREAASPRDFCAFCCEHCGSLLTLHQPDPELPDRLLATCDECKSWYLSNSTGTALIPIPRLVKRNLALRTN